MQHLRTRRYFLANDEVWDENDAVFESVPLCGACDKFGHAAAQCPLYGGQARDPSNMEHAPVAHIAGEYIVEKLGCTYDNQRVVRVNGRDYCVKKATPKEAALLRGWKIDYGNVITVSNSRQ